ncbi:MULTISPECIES: FxDxF family PEP-CTERM protein [Silvimonas]|uniref:FxDxF family PEP-CTERM protein n=1 Tax=Silvimonas TaxID=300264 RepID=UPI0024B3BA04|nr:MULTISPECIES: FxDxF family PEP-CTERM protein [Silvimonas]MDR3429650.1 FxDxF family PEP-CTERM protein [Silvimonas sp.]
MKIRHLVTSLAFVGASAGALAIPTVRAQNSLDLGVVHSPTNFIIDNTVTSSTFDDFIKFGVTPTSYADNVFFSQLSLGNLQKIATATLSLWDITSGNPLTYTFFGSVPLNEPAFTAAEMFLAGHTYALEVKGTLQDGAVQGVYGILGTLTPVPEPETYALLGLGMVALVAARMRRRKSGLGGSFNSLAAVAV